MKKRYSNRLHSKTYSKRLRSNSNIQSSGLSKKTYHCSGCNKDFFNFNSVSEFLKHHMKVSSTCSNAIITYEKCQKQFINEKGFMSHLSRSNKDCLNFHNRCALKNAKIESYSTSQITIPDLEQPSFEKSAHQKMISSSRFLTSSVQKLSIKELKKQTKNKAQFIEAKIPEKLSSIESVNNNNSTSTITRNKKISIDQTNDEIDDNSELNNLFLDEDKIIEQIEMSNDLDIMKHIDNDDCLEDDSDADNSNASVISFRCNNSNDSTLES